MLPVEGQPSSLVGLPPGIFLLRGTTLGLSYTIRLERDFVKFDWRVSAPQFRDQKLCAPSANW